MEDDQQVARNRATELRAFWYPVARSTELGAAPLARRLNGTPLALFRDAEGRARALHATCPHRGASLAHGQVERGQLACPYHGWRFSGDGRCTLIPSQPERAVPTGFSTASFDAREQQGFIWVSTSEKPVAAPPHFPALDDRTLHPFFEQGVIAVPFDWWVENALDVAHLPFVHRASYGGQSARVDGYAVERAPDELGFTARTVTRQRFSLFARLLHRSAGHLEMRMVVTHAMAGNTFFDIDLGHGKRQGLLFLAAPEDGSTTRYFVVVLRNYLRLPFADLVGRRFLRKVIREDIALAARSGALVSRRAERLLSAEADAPALEFLRLLKLWHTRERGGE